MKILCFILMMIPGTQTEWLNDMSAAKEIAARDHKYILLNFSGSDWCAPCIKMKKEVFESDQFKTVANKDLVLVNADFPRSRKNKLSSDQSKINEALAETYNMEGKFPLTLLLNAKGKILKEWDGYVFSSQDKFMNELTSMINSMH
jgi:thioredoxin-related protein